MTADAEGFVFPRVDTDKCVDCGLCERVCPMLHPESERTVQRVYGAKHSEETVRKSSSSGGVFSLLAERFIDQGGEVVGCLLDEHMQAVHAVASRKEDLIAFRSSKYVQSNLEGIFVKIRASLKNGKRVMFTGTPCQVAGLRRFLMKPYENLFCVDVLCHGVPSPKLFRDYLRKMERLYGGEARHVNFRCKRKEWKRLYMNIIFDNGRDYFKYCEYDWYMKLFLADSSQRNSCFHCPFTTVHRQGDISLGDFWGIGREYPKLDDNKGISLVIVNSDAGLAMYREISDRLTSFESDLNLAIAGNKVLCRPIGGEERRDRFYSDYVLAGLDAALAENVRMDSYWKQQYYTVMRRVLDIVRKILRKGY